MKKTLIPIAILFLLCSCMSDESKIRKAATGYLNATATYDVESACQYCTPETAASLKTIQECILPQLDSAYLSQNAQADIAILDIIRLNDTAAKVVYSKKTPLTYYSDTLSLVRRDGNWMAHLNIVVPPIATKRYHKMHYDTTAVFQIASE